MLKQLKKQDKGFTIIEVMIVLAIAGLILLIVFLAVPALQRSSRNTNRRTDASRIASSANNFVTNNNGTLPATAPNATAIINDAGTLGQYGTLTGGGAASAPATACAAGSMVASQLVVCAGAANFNPLARGSDGLVLAVNAQCDSATGPGAVTAAAGRQMALVYTLETTTATDNLACLNI